MNKLELGERIRALRKDMKLRQEDLASKSGVSLPVIKSVESGKGNPTLESLSLLSSVLGTSLGELFSGEDNKPRREEAYEQGPTTHVNNRHEGNRQHGANEKLNPKRLNPDSRDEKNDDITNKISDVVGPELLHSNSSEQNSDDFRDLIAILPALDDPKISSLLDYARTLAPMDLSNVQTKKKTL